MSAKLSPQAQSEAILRWTRFQAFIEGCKMQLGLEGNWNLNTATWEFEEVQTDGAVH